MRISRFETIPIQGRAMILKMLTDEGLVGYGEPIKEPLVFRNGFIELPTGPGLGIEIEDEAIEAIRNETHRVRGMLRFEEDGSFADY